MLGPFRDLKCLKDDGSAFPTVFRLPLRQMLMLAPGAVSGGGVAGAALAYPVVIRVP